MALVSSSTTPLADTETAWSSLPNFGQYTRLLHLHPGLGSDGIVCERTIVDLQHSRGSYTAVSYTWGDEAHLFPILLDGRVFHIRKNLYELLLEFRSVDHTLILWIDAICIDQNSLEERNHQVNLIGEIFRGAAQVRAWLGVASPEEHDAFASIKDLVKIDPTNAQQPQTDSFSLWEKGVAVITGNSYWSRSWIIQELVLAQDIVIHCGSNSCHWHELLQLVSCVKKDNAIVVREIANTQNDAGLTLSVLFKRFGRLGCTIDHDKFYSLYGMVDQSSVPSPDYSLCLTQVIIQQLSVLQEQLILDHTCQEENLYGTPERYPLSFFDCIRRNIKLSHETGTFCSCHSSDTIVRLELPLSGYVQQVGREQSPPMFSIHREHDIYRFRRFTSDFQNGDLAFDLSPTLILVVRSSTKSSRAWIRPIKLVHHSSNTRCYQPTLFKDVSLKLSNQVLTVMMPIGKMLSLLDFLSESELRMKDRIQSQERVQLRLLRLAQESSCLQVSNGPRQKRPEDSLPRGGF